MASLSRCVICCFAKSNIVEERTWYLQKALSYYWERAGLEMKPKESAKYDVCATCFNKIEELYEAHRAREFLRDKMTDYKQKFTTEFRKEIANRITNKMPLLSVHTKFLEILNYKDSRKPEDID